MGAGENAQQLRANAEAAKRRAAQEAETARENARAKAQADAAAKKRAQEDQAARAAAAKKANDEAAAKKLADAYRQAQATPGYHGVSTNSYTPPVASPVTTSNHPPSGSGNGGPSSSSDPTSTETPIAKVIPAVVTSVAVGGQMNPSVYEAYIAEIKRLTLKLVKNSKNLLLAYDFQSVNRAVDYYIDTDKASRTSATVVKRAVPHSIVDLNTIAAQELASNLVNTLAEYLADTVNDSVRYNYFGTDVAGTWSPSTPSFSGGIPYYDLKVNVPIDSRIKNIQVSLYEV